MWKRKRKRLKNNRFRIPDVNIILFANFSERKERIKKLLIGVGLPNTI